MSDENFFLAALFKNSSKNITQKSFNNDSVKAKKIYIERAGLATSANLAVDILKQNVSSILVVSNSSQLHEALSLARVFLPEMSEGRLSLNKPLWDWPLVSLPAMRKVNSRTEWSERMSGFYSLSFRSPRIIVAEYQSLLLRYMPKDFFEKHYLELKKGSDYSPELIIDQLIEWGYVRGQMVTMSGEIARRGDILDIFPIGYRHPVRLEFFGDTIDEMRLFDGESQRSIGEIDQITLIPASPIAGANPEEVKKRFSQLQSSGQLKENDAYSLKKVLENRTAEILPGLIYPQSSFFEDWLPENTIWFLPGESESNEALQTERNILKSELESENNDEDDNGFIQPAKITIRRGTHAAPWQEFPAIFSEPLRIGVEEKGLNLPEKDINSFSALFPQAEANERPWQTLVHGLKNFIKKFDQLLLVFSSDRGRKKFLALAEKDEILPFTRYARNRKGVFALISPYRKGVELEWKKILILGEDILFPRAEKQQRKVSRAFKGLDSFEGLKQGDLIVHRDYGIGKFAGLHHLVINNIPNDFLLLEYQDDDKLYVPVDRLELIQRFKGPEGANPILDKLGSQSWSLGKEKARKAIEKIASDLVDMYAYRKIAKSFKYSPPDEIYREFEATFGFEETPDQAKAIQDVLEDMERDTPMDRLICGDVGFGKTEVALRAAFRAAEEGRQVVLLCPTTVLAEQHYQTFRSRLSGFPINVGLLSRFVPRAKQKEVLKSCETGQTDILIGTHRLLSNDVKLPNLALLILDEEQRFGVRHKEKLKSLKKNVDVLTLTATPIPRTLQLSMSGIRDLSIIETAPVDRKPVASAVLAKDDETLEKVLKRELERKGQVFWVYNRVHDLEQKAAYVKKLVPEARVGMAHGQMAESVLETTMRQFWHGEIDVLVCTSIVESGLDFPHANTLIVDQAQMFGLSQLYQLRGRVGRSDRQAYAFFVVPDARHLSETAEERLRVILNMDYLGAGFQVAMEDLRLRGAGNILGEAQSGHITRVGLDLYLEMLEEAVARYKGLPQAIHETTEINLGITAHIPQNYIENGKDRLKYYKSLTSAQNAQDREELALEIRDRYGSIPEELNNFLAILDFKQYLTNMQAARADVNKDFARITWPESQTAIDPAKVTKLLADNKDVKLAGASTLIFSLDENKKVKDNFSMIRKNLDKIVINPV